MRVSRQCLECSTNLTEAVGEIEEKAYAQGVRDALGELLDIYGEGIKETDLWAQHMEEEGVSA